MMCCQACPFHPISESDDLCVSPRCSSNTETCHRLCRPEVRYRCPQDDFVVRGLPAMDPLAVMLAPFTLDTACEGRDRRLLIDLFRAASEGVRGRLWLRLGEHRERALWLINPLLEAAGLARADEFRVPETGSAKDCAIVPPPPTSGILRGGYPVGDEALVTALVRQELHGYQPSEGSSGPATICGQAAAWFRELEQDPDRLTRERPLALGMQEAGDHAFLRLRRAVSNRDADALCDLFTDVPAMLRSALWRYLLLFHAQDLDLLNPLFERHELPPLERGDTPAELGDYRQALWNE